MDKKTESRPLVKIRISSSCPPVSPGLVGDGAFVHLVQVIPHADGQPVPYLPTVHCVHHPEHLSSGEAQTNRCFCLVVKVSADVEVVSQIGFDDLLID